jgi:glycosyltransferase involved in cell wall biosynthesis
LSRQHYDIIYATTSKTIPNAAFAAIGFPAKVVAYRGTTGGLYRHDPTAYLTILHPRVDGVICVSEAVRQDVLAQVWKNRDRVVTIHKGHELDWYQATPADLGEFGIAPADFVIICAVNARPSKGIDVMLQAADLLADHERMHLLLAGLGMDKEPYTRLIANNRMRERIHVAGFRQDAPQLIAASDVLVQPSVSGEGLPRAVMEAVSYGTPVVITDTGGGKEVIEDGKSGFVVAARDPAAIADRIARLYADTELARHMAAAGKERLRTEFSSANTVAQTIAYFESLLPSSQT